MRYRVTAGRHGFDAHVDQRTGRSKRDERVTSARRKPKYGPAYVSAMRYFENVTAELYLILRRVTLDSATGVTMSRSNHVVLSKKM